VHHYSHKRHPRQVTSLVFSEGQVTPLAVEQLYVVTSTDRSLSTALDIVADCTCHAHLSTHGPLL
jgi:hypothetical protein